jgi:DNA-binding XRE family transcriptional regulator
MIRTPPKISVGFVEGFWRRNSFALKWGYRNTRSRKLLAELPLEQLRCARSLTPTNMAQILGVNQRAISKIEKRTGMYLSTLRSYVEAMGGSLEIRAVFLEGAVRVDI